MTTVFAARPEVPTQQPRFPKGEGYGALVGDKWVRLAPNAEQPVRYYTKDSLAPRGDDTGSVYENVLDIGYAFARGDLSGGEGLDWYPRFISQLDDQEVKDKIRYWDSENIDIRRPVRGELSRITLSQDLDIWRSEPDMQDLATTDDYLIVLFGDDWERWSDWDAGSPDSSGVLSETAQAVEASPQGDAYFLLDSGTLEFLPAESNVSALVPNVDNVVQHWFAKGRLIVLRAEGNGFHALYEVDETGYVRVDPDVATNGIPFDTFKGMALSVVGSGPAVVAAIDDGTVRTYVPEQANQIDPDSVTLVIRGRTDMPTGEVPFLLGSNADILLIASRTTGNSPDNDIRLYQAEVLDARFDYVVGQLSLRREWTDTALVEDRRKNMANTRDEIWFLVHEDATTQCLWRFDLVTFGLSRHHTNPLVSSAHSVVLWDKRGGYISNTDIYRSSDDFVNEGWLITPNITFGVNTDINFIAAVFAATGLQAAGKQVELWYSTDPEAILDDEHPSWRLAIRGSNPEQSNAEAFLTEVTDRQIALMIRLFSSEGRTKAPNVNNFAVRGLPQHRDWILELPVNVSDHLEVPGRRPIRIPGYGNVLHNQMLTLEGSSVEIRVLDPPFLFRGVVDNIVEPTQYITDRGGVSVRCILQCRGTRLTATATATGDSGLGIGTLGIATLGIGQTDRT